MNEILSTIITALVLVAGLVALARWARNDVYAAPGRRRRSPDPLSPDAPVPDRARRQRTVARTTNEGRPATYESHATTLTA